MEIVLRKVMCSERLPNKSGNYYVGTIDGFHDYYNFNKENLRHRPLWLDRVEYWYEEVNLMGFVDNAKERYEKAKKYLDNYHELIGMNMYTETPICLKAIKIASGLEE